MNTTYETKNKMVGSARVQSHQCIKANKIKFKRERKFVYTLLYSKDSSKDSRDILIFQRSKTCNWGDLEIIVKPFKNGDNAFFSEAHDAAKTIYLGTGYDNRNPLIWVLPGGAEDGKGDAHAFTELKEETGISLTEGEYEISWYKDDDFSVALLNITAAQLTFYCDLAMTNFNMCDEYRRRLREMPSFDAAVNMVREKAPPLVSDELCACKIVTVREAINEFRKSENTNWFARALQHLESDEGGF